MQVLVDKYTHTRAVFVIRKSGHVKMVLVVCGFSDQSKDATTVAFVCLLSAVVLVVVVVIIKYFCITCSY